MADGAGDRAGRLYGALNILYPGNENIFLYEIFICKEKHICSKKTNLHSM